MCRGLTKWARPEGPIRHEQLGPGGGGGGLPSSPSELAVLLKVRRSLWCRGFLDVVELLALEVVDEQEEGGEELEEEDGEWEEEEWQ